MLYQRFYPNSNIELFASLMFDHLDADQSGAIDFVEFYQVIIVTELSLDQQVVNMVFNGGKSDHDQYYRLLNEPIFSRQEQQRPSGAARSGRSDDCCL